MNALVIIATDMAKTTKEIVKEKLFIIKKYLKKNWAMLTIKIFALYGLASFFQDIGFIWID